MAQVQVSGSEPLLRALEATGYLSDGQEAHGVVLGRDSPNNPPWRSFKPDGQWSSESDLRVYFKSVPDAPDDSEVSAWRREIWNEGRSPLMWVVSRDRIDLYDAFRRPQIENDAQASRLRTFRLIDEELADLNRFAGRVSMETGQFWQEAMNVDRKSSVDEQLLTDLERLEADLLRQQLPVDQAQALIMRSLFCQYLFDRRIVNQDRLRRLCGEETLSRALRHGVAANRLFSWLRDTFNGDLFTATDPEEVPTTTHLERVADFLDAVDPDTGQTTLFPYQFDIIPVELISFIYERFARAVRDLQPGGAVSKSTKSQGVHYTRLALVSFVMDEVMDGFDGLESVLDITCGSGVFLVEALRQLVKLRAAGRAPTRSIIRSTLYEQVYGVDINKAAVRVAAFSLYLAALELEHEPSPPEALRFKPLIGRTLHIADALAIESIPLSGKPTRSRKPNQAFDVIVGNPPWSYGGRNSTVQFRSRLDSNIPLSPRSRQFAFVQRSMDFAGPDTRFGLVLGASPFFSAAKSGQRATRDILRKLAPVTVVSLANHQDWLFRRASTPAIAIFGRHRPVPQDRLTVVQVPWTPAGRRSHTFDISANDVVRLPLSAWEHEPTMLKAAFWGKRRDIALLNRLVNRLDTLESQLLKVGTQLQEGMELGHGGSDASFAYGLPLLGPRDLRPFKVPAGLAPFTKREANRPRSRALFRAPLLLVKEYVNKNARLVAALAEHDVVFTNSHYGAPLPPERRALGLVGSALLNSSLASWFFLMSSFTFGLWKRRILRKDVVRLPCPDLSDATSSSLGRRVLEAAATCGERTPNKYAWEALDNAVFALYGLDDHDRVIVRDGLFRATWQWHSGRVHSVERATVHPVVTSYAQNFLMVIDGWLAAEEGWRMRAEVIGHQRTDPLRVVRFVLEHKPGPSLIQVVQPSGDLSEILRSVEDRLNIRLSESVYGCRELRAYQGDEVVIIKPAARHHWLGVSALEDADKVVEESFAGTRA